MTLTLGFGPFRFALEGAAELPPLLVPFVRQSRDETAEIVEIPDAHAPIMALLTDRLVRTAARAGLFVLHAAGLFVETHPALRAGAQPGGVTLLAGASGTGKSTAARAAGNRAFCYNAALVDPVTALAWPLPFTGKADPPLAQIAPARVCQVAVLGRGEPFGRIRAERALAHVAIAKGDCNAIDSIASALRFFRKIPLLTLTIPPPVHLANMLDSIFDEANQAEGVGA